MYLENLSHVKIYWQSIGQSRKVRAFCPEAGKCTFISMVWKDGNGSLNSDYRGECPECRNNVALSAMRNVA